MSSVKHETAPNFCTLRAGCLLIEKSTQQQANLCRVPVVVSFQVVLVHLLHTVVPIDELAFVPQKLNARFAVGRLYKDLKQNHTSSTSRSRELKAQHRLILFLKRQNSENDSATPTVPEWRQFSVLVPAAPQEWSQRRHPSWAPDSSHLPGILAASFAPVPPPGSSLLKLLQDYRYIMSLYGDQDWWLQSNVCDKPWVPVFVVP